MITYVVAMGRRDATGDPLRIGIAGRVLIRLGRLGRYGFAGGRGAYGFAVDLIGGGLALGGGLP